MFFSICNYYWLLRFRSPKLKSIYFSRNLVDRIWWRPWATNSWATRHQVISWSFLIHQPSPWPLGWKAGHGYIFTKIPGWNCLHVAGEPKLQIMWLPRLCILHLSVNCILTNKILKPPEQVYNPYKPQMGHQQGENCNKTCRSSSFINLRFFLENQMVIQKNIQKNPFRKPFGEQKQLQNEESLVRCSTTTTWDLSKCLVLPNPNYTKYRQYKTIQFTELQ